MSKVSVSDALFTKTQQRVLGLLYGNPAKSFYTNEIVRWADMGRGTIRRELERLVSAGLLLDKHEGNQLHYRANSDNPIYKELIDIVRKTFGVVDVINQALHSIYQHIDLVFIYGSMAKGEDTASSDIDLMVVADALAYADLMAALSGAEKSLGRPINPTIYDKAEIKRKLSEKNAFLTRVLNQPKLWVKGTEDDINEFG
jgi:predicted nucleotidyltransferase